MYDDNRFKSTLLIYIIRKGYRQKLNYFHSDTDIYRANANAMVIYLYLF